MVNQRTFLELPKFTFSFLSTRREMYEFFAHYKISSGSTCSRLRLDKLTTAQVINEFPSFYEIGMLSNVFTGFRN
jgi:hypothetical protein